MLNSLNGRPRRFPCQINVGEIVPLSHVFVILYNPVIDGRCYTVILDDGITPYMPDPDVSIVIDPVKVVPVDYNGPLEVSISSHVDIYIGYSDISYNDRSRSPAAVTVVGLPGSQGHPTDAHAEVYPGYSSRIPEKRDRKERRAHANPDTGHWRRPIPKTSCEYPAAVVVSYVSKWFTRNPGVVPVPYRPSSHGKWRPSNADMNGTPEIAVGSIVVNSLPSTMLVQNVSFMMEPWR